MSKFFSPFETGVRLSGWRWYWKFLCDHPEMDQRVEHDCYAALMPTTYSCRYPTGLVMA